MSNANDLEGPLRVELTLVPLGDPQTAGARLQGALDMARRRGFKVLRCERLPDESRASGGLTPPAAGPARGRRRF